MQTGEVLDAIGGLSSQLKAYAAKLPAIVHLTIVPTGIKPKPEAVDDYDESALWSEMTPRKEK